MVRLGMGVLLAFSLAGCSAEKFVSPDKPDLYKVPYDFGPVVDLTGADLSGSDMNASVDLALPPDDLDEHD